MSTKTLAWGLLLSFGSVVTVYAEKAPAAKTATDYYLTYHATMANAKSVEDLRPFMDAASQKQMDAASKEEKEMGVRMISGMYADITDLKVVKETASGNVYKLEVTAKQKTDGQAGTGTVEVLKDGGNWKVQEEIWKFGDSTMTLKTKKED